MTIPKNSPGDLAVPTDLLNNDVVEIAELLNNIIADSFALYVKTKNFHWHVYGPHFTEYHELFGEQADQILGSIDVLAERVRKLGKITIRSIGDIQDLTDIEDSNEVGMECADMFKELLEDNKMVVESMRKAIEVCEENNDRTTSNILQGFQDDAEKRVWFLFELTK